MTWNLNSPGPILPAPGSMPGGPGLPPTRAINPSAPLPPSNPTIPGAVPKVSSPTGSDSSKDASTTHARAEKSPSLHSISQPVPATISAKTNLQNPSIAHHDAKHADHSLLPSTLNQGITAKAAGKSRARSPMRGIDLWMLALVGVAAVFSSLAFLRVDQLYAAIRDLNTKVGSLSSNNLAAATLPSAKPTTPDPIADTAVPVEAGSDDPVIGSSSAKVTIIEFSDFQCPFCKKFQPTVKQILSTYSPSQVRLVYRDFPLDFHENAEPAAIAAQCVFDQAGSDAFFEYHDQLFERQDELSDALYLELAKKISSLDQATFKKCVDNKETLSEVQQDAADGALAGVNGTPATFVNGRLISGALPFAQVKAVIDEELNK